jgi:hypothetical protein
MTEQTRVFVLVKAWADKSAFYICGVTSSEAVARAFVAGGDCGGAEPFAYPAFLDDQVRTLLTALAPMEFE